MKQPLSPGETLSEKQIRSGYVKIIAEGAVAAVIYSAATGNFMTGYLGMLGFGVTGCAAIAMIPQFGCVLQLISPFFFERLHRRKRSIVVLCAIFRFFAAMTFLLPILALDRGYTVTLVVIFYTISFLAAGFVTPGLQLMILAASPEKERGTFFAKKDIVATVINSSATLLMGKQLDLCIRAGQTLKGYLYIGAICLFLAGMDAALLTGIHEKEMPFVSGLKPKILLDPVKDTVYRKLFYYCVISGFTGGIASPFLSVYQLQILGLSHTFIAVVGVLAAAAGIIGSYAWGRFADHASFAVTLQRTTTISLCSTLGWAFTGIIPAVWIVPVLSVASAACAGANGVAVANLQYMMSPENGKTAYLGATGACASIAACISAAMMTSLHPFIESVLHEKSIPFLFLLSGVAGFANLKINGSSLDKGVRSR